MRNRVRNRIDDETGADAVEALFGRFGLDARHVGFAEALDVLVGVEPQLLLQVQTFALGLLEARQDREHGRKVERVRIQMHGLERRCARYELAVDARLIFIGKRIRHLDDDHAVQQGLVLFFLQETVELGQVRMSNDGLIEMNQRKAGYLDVLFLRQRQ